MRQHVNRFRSDISDTAIMFALLNTFVMVGAEVGVGINATQSSSSHDLTRMPIATPISESSASDSSPITPTSAGSAQGASVSTRRTISPGVIAGISVAAIILLIVVLTLFVLCRRERKQQQQRRGPVNLTSELDPIGSPVYEKRFIPFPFLTDIEAGELGHDQPTRRIEARFIPAAQLHSGLRNSSQPLAGSGSPFSTQKLDSSEEEDHSSEDHYIEETPQRVHSLLAQLERHPDPKEDSVLSALGGDARPVYDHH